MELSLWRMCNHNGCIWIVCPFDFGGMALPQFFTSLPQIVTQSVARKLRFCYAFVVMPVSLCCSPTGCCCFAQICSSKFFCALLVEKLPRSALPAVFCALLLNRGCWDLLCSQLFCAQNFAQICSARSFSALFCSKEVADGQGAPRRKGRSWKHSAATCSYMRKSLSSALVGQKSECGKENHPK